MAIFVYCYFQNSKKVAKRLLKQRQAIYASLARKRNRGISISEQNPMIEDENDINSQNDQANDKKSKQRGPTRMANLKGKEPIEVDLNVHGQTIDVTSITLSSYIGTVVREHVPVTLSSWKEVDDQTKEMLWSAILVRIYISLCLSLKFYSSNFGGLT